MKIDRIKFLQAKKRLADRQIECNIQNYNQHLTEELEKWSPLINRTMYVHKRYRE